MFLLIHFVDMMKLSQGAHDWPAYNRYQLPRERRRDVANARAHYEQLYAQRRTDLHVRAFFVLF